MTEATPPAEKTNSWQDWANRTTAVLAVLAALSSGRWGASNLQAILEQGKVNDTWALYQAKSIKEHGAEQTRDLAKALAPGSQIEQTAGLTALQSKADNDAKHEITDKNEQFKAAGTFEKRRDSMVERGFWFELSFAALQLGVILSTIAAAAKTRGVWLTSVVCGLLGLLFFVNGFTRTVVAPHSWYSGASEDMAYEGKPPPDAK